MFADEGDARCASLVFDVHGNFGLTIWAADLSWGCDDDLYSQGNYDYQAHAHVYEGGADPLGSQGFVNVARHPSSS
jgi:hypothetical protein